MVCDGIYMRAGLSLAIDDGVRESAEGINAKAGFGWRAEPLVPLDEFYDSIELSKEGARDAAAGFSDVVDGSVGKFALDGGGGACSSRDLRADSGYSLNARNHIYFPREYLCLSAERLIQPRLINLGVAIKARNQALQNASAIRRGQI